MTIIEKGIQKGLIRLDDDKKFIYYTKQDDKKRNYSNPEEQVQAEAYLKLIFTYGYAPERIKQFVIIKDGSTSKEVDIIVYNDDDCTMPHIVVECKKEDVSEAEFNEAIKQAFSYANFLHGTTKYIWTTSGIKNEYFLYIRERNIRQSIPDIPKFGVTEIQKYKFVKGGKKADEDAGNDPIKQKYFELDTVSEDTLTKSFKLAHNSIWAGGQYNPSEAFDELDKLIFCKIWDERKPRKKGEPYDFQIFSEPIPKNATKEELAKIDKKITNELYKRINALYDEGKKKDPEVFKENVRLSPEKIRTVVTYLEEINLGATDLDSKGRAFETFMGSYFRGDFGQFFTPRPIVKFIVDILPITNDSKVLDTSCGSGGFLLYALDKVRQQATEYYDEGTVEHYKYWHDFAEYNLFGIEINEQIARTAKMNMIIHDDGHTNVISSDGLLRSETIVERTKNQGFKYNNFDFIVTNPPFGSSVKQTEKAYLHQYRLGNKDTSWLDLNNSAVQGRSNQSTEVLFIEQCHNFLKEGAFLAIVIPDGILTNSSLQDIRNQIEEWYRIVAVVSMPQTAFSHTGAGVKSSILVLRKWSKATTERINSQKKLIQKRIKDEYKYTKTVKAIDTKKKNILKNLTNFDNTTGEIDLKKLKKTDEYKTWKTETSNDFRQEINDLKEQLEDVYLETKQNELPDYPIFMAIAEDIGYDATGRDTGTNELEIIGEELSRFIVHITKNEEI
jgi:type I restriction enzyme M protein